LEGEEGERIKKKFTCMQVISKDLPSFKDTSICVFQQSVFIQLAIRQARGGREWRGEERRGERVKERERKESTIAKVMIAP
jgi:hypothetical protein